MTVEPSALSLEALILAGGNSTRMGQDKALLQRRGQVPLLTHLCQVAQTHCQRVWVLSPRLPLYAPLLPQGCIGLQESRAADAPPSGPLLAFAEGLAQVEAEWVLLLACDLPALTAPVIASWLPWMAQADSEAIALLPQGTKGWEPLCGFYRRRALSRLQGAIVQGERSFQRWLAQETVTPLPVADKHVLQNCNTPVDWEDFQQSQLNA